MRTDNEPGQDTAQPRHPGRVTRRGALLGATVALPATAPKDATANRANLHGPQSMIPADLFIDGNAADETQALQRAITAARAGGGILMFSARTYRISSTLDLPSGIQLIGAGAVAGAGPDEVPRARCCSGPATASCCAWLAIAFATAGRYGIRCSYAASCSTAATSPATSRSSWPSPGSPSPNAFSCAAAGVTCCCTRCSTAASATLTSMVEAGQRRWRPRPSSWRWDGTQQVRVAAAAGTVLQPGDAIEVALRVERDAAGMVSGSLR